MVKYRFKTLSTAFYYGTPTIYVFKVHIFWESYKILRNLHLTFDRWYIKDKSKVEISQNFVAFSEYMNFTSGSFTLLIFLCKTKIFWTGNNFLVRSKGQFYSEKWKVWAKESWKWMVWMLKTVNRYWYIFLRI